MSLILRCSRRLRWLTRWCSLDDVADVVASAARADFAFAFACAAACIDFSSGLLCMKAGSATSSSRTRFSYINTTHSFASASSYACAAKSVP
eukprot:6471738-Amphidinium_carterae.1